MCKQDISRVIIAGAGTMGITLSRLFAQAGYCTTLWNRRTPSLEKAKSEIANSLSHLAAEGHLEESPAKIAQRLTYTTEWEAFSAVDFVVENIAEDLSVKQEFFRTISRYVPEEIVLTTNTSGLRVTDLATAVSNPSRFCGMHWWNPPDLIPLVEITKGAYSSQESTEIVRTVAEHLGKKPVIVKKDILGILGNRLQYAVLREALHILELGAAGPEEIDAAMKYGPGFRYPTLGPFETVDLGGLDIFRTVSNYLFAELGNETSSAVLNQLADAGQYGIKTGAGFYPYPDDCGADKLSWRNEQFQKQLELLK